MDRLADLPSFLFAEFAIGLLILFTMPVLVVIFYVWASRSGYWSFNPNARSQSAYFSTPEHNTSFVGQCVWIYTGKGMITLDPNAVTIELSGISRQIPFSDIVGLHVGRYSRMAKPITLKYIELSYRDGSAVQTILITPAVSWTAPVWKTNEIVEKWAERLQRARAQAT